MTDRPDEPDHDARDGCLCGLDHGEHETTEDHDLPEAKGGVEGDRLPRKRARKGTKTALAGEA